MTTSVITSVGVLDERGEPLLRPDSIGDVAGVQDDAADPGIVDEVACHGLEVHPSAAVSGSNAEHERLATVRSVEHLLERLERRLDVVLVQQAEDPAFGIEAFLVAEQPRAGRARRAPRAVGLQHRDDVGRVGDERAEPVLGLRSGNRASSSSVPESQPSPLRDDSRFSSTSRDAARRPAAFATMRRCRCEPTAVTTRAAPTGRVRSCASAGSTSRPRRRGDARTIAPASSCAASTPAGSSAACSRASSLRSPEPAGADVAALLDAAEDIVNSAAPEIVAELEQSQSKRRFGRKKKKRSERSGGTRRRRASARGASGGSRTLKPRRAPGPKPGASAVPPRSLPYQSRVSAHVQGDELAGRGELRVAGAARTAEVDVDLDTSVVLGRGRPSHDQIRRARAPRSESGARPRRAPRRP